MKQLLFVSAAFLPFRLTACYQQMQNVITAAVNESQKNETNKITIGSHTPGIRNVIYETGSSQTMFVSRKRAKNNQL